MLSNEPVKGRNIVRALLEEYPLEIGVCLVMIPVGIEIVTPPYPRADGNIVWDVFAVILGASLTVSAIVLIGGLVQWVRTLEAGWEQLGFWMAAGAVATNIYMEAITGGASAAGYMLHAFIIVAFLARAAGIRRKSHSRSKHLVVVKELREEVEKHDPRDPHRRS